MTLAEKLISLRKKEKLTQEDLAKATGLDRTTIVRYENGKTYPRTREKYVALANALNVDVSFLLTNNEEFIISADEQGGNRAARQAMALATEIGVMFAGGNMAEEDSDAVMQALQAAYWDAKAKNKETYTPKKFKEKGGN